LNAGRDCSPVVFKALVAAWHRLAKPRDGDGEPVDAETVYGEFLTCWPRIKYPESDPLRDVLASTPCPPEAAHYESDQMRQLAAMCAGLQHHAGDGVFYLSCRSAAMTIGHVDQVTVWRYFRVLVADGLLKQMTPGTATRAARWRWLGK